MWSIPVISQVLINGLSLSAVYILVALGFTLLFGILGVVNFAHGGFAMLGGFSVYLLMHKLGFSFLVGLPLSVIAIAVLALLIEPFAYRPFYQKEMPGMIATLGLSMVFTYSAAVLMGTEHRGLPPEFTDIYQVGTITISQDRGLVIAVVSVALIAFYAFLKFTKIGLAMRVVAQDREIAEAQGIDTRKTYRYALFLAAALASLAGCLWAQLYGVSPFLGEQPLLKAFIVVILGGLGSVAGAAVGGLILGMGESIVSTFYGASVAQFMAFGAIILILLFRPSGLFGLGE